MRFPLQSTLANLPPEWPKSLLADIQRRVGLAEAKVVVLDDDPTGTQTVHDVPVLTEWSEPTLRQALVEPGAVVYLLTNSRSLPLSGAEAINQEIATNLRAASRASSRPFVVVSRSDSTLRGHYPGEVSALSDALGGSFHGTLICPFFLEGGRFTINDIHYVAEGNWLVPAGETEYARDAAFGYRASDLRQWVSDKHAGRIKPEDVASISIELLRTTGPDGVRDVLEQLDSDRVCIVNAASYRDVEVFVAGLLSAEAAGRRFIYRTAASFVRVRGGIEPRPCLTPEAYGLSASAQGGLIVAGSYVGRTSRQIEAAKRLSGLVSVELDVSLLLNARSRDREISRVAAAASSAIAGCRDALVFTSRNLITASSAEDALAIGGQVSTGLVSVVQQIKSRPAWMIAKGGITSSAVATQGLSITRAQVLGQALPGVPVWKAGDSSRWPGMIYVVFPGNVGSDDALAQTINLLRAARRSAESISSVGS